MTLEKHQVVPEILTAVASFAHSKDSGRHEVDTFLEEVLTRERRRQWVSRKLEEYLRPSDLDGPAGEMLCETLADQMEQIVRTRFLPLSDPVRQSVLGAMRILGFQGSNTQEHEDCVALLDSYGGLIGSGVLLSEDVVATAAHNLGTTCRKPAAVGFGHDIYHSIKKAAVSQPSCHDGFDSDTLAFDLALLFLDEPSSVATLHVAPSTIGDTLNSGVSFGFGANEIGGVAGIGQKRKLEYVGGVVHLCHQAEGLVPCEPDVATKVQLGDDYHVICDYDSGGPLYVRSGGRELVLGIASEPGSQTGECKGGSIFLRLDRERDWIEETISKGGGKMPEFA